MAWSPPPSARPWTVTFDATTSSRLMAPAPVAGLTPTHGCVGDDWLLHPLIETRPLTGTGEPIEMLWLTTAAANLIPSAPLRAFASSAAARNVHVLCPATLQAPSPGAASP